VLGLAGLRFGECAALRVVDVDLLRRRLKVTASVSEIGGKQVVDPEEPPDPGCTDPAVPRRAAGRRDRREDTGRPAVLLPGWCTVAAEELAPACLGSRCRRCWSDRSHPARPTPHGSQPGAPAILAPSPRSTAASRHPCSRPRNRPVDRAPMTSGRRGLNVSDRPHRRRGPGQAHSPSKHGRQTPGCSHPGPLSCPDAANSALLRPPRGLTPPHGCSRSTAEGLKPGADKAQQFVGRAGLEPATGGL
jgi:hypothetical protein